MRSISWGSLALFVVVGAEWGCSGSDTTTLSGQGTGGAAAGNAGSGGSSGGGGSGGVAGGAGQAGSGMGGSSGAGTGGTNTGGASGSSGGAGGSSGGGVGGSATGGAAGSGGAAASFWPNAYDPAGTAAIKSGEHNAGKDCLSCHTGTGDAPQWLFAGTMHDSTGAQPMAHVEVAVKDPGGFYAAFSATNGNFWVPFTGKTVDWSNAEIRARDSNGEVMMSGTAAAGCNSCHAAMPIKAP